MVDLNDRISFVVKLVILFHILILFRNHIVSNNSMDKIRMIEEFDQTGQMIEMAEMVETIFDEDETVGWIPKDSPIGMTRAGLGRAVTVLEDPSY